MYIITGATGNTGGIVARRLLEAGKKVCVIGRDAGRLQPFVDLGAEAAVGSLDDAAFVKKAFDGGTAAYAMIPPDFQTEDLRAYQNRIGENIAVAVEAAGIRHVVHLSSLGADVSEGTGPILGVHDQEQRLNKIEGLNVVHLRPTYFMENVIYALDMIRGQGINGSPLKPDLRIPVIATQDVGDVAADLLTALDFSGQSVRELLGPADVSMNEMTATLGKAAGKADLPYIQFPYDQAQQAMVGMGISNGVAASFMQMNRAINEGRAIHPKKRDPKSTTKTTFGEFVNTVIVPMLTN